MKSRWFIGFLALSLSCLACEPPNRSDESGDENADVRSTSDVPVTRVVLYRSGVAYVERQGSIDADTLSFQIRPDQINDILATLTIIVDRGDNIASSIGVPIERTVAEELDRLPDQVRQQGGMLSLLEAFRGAEVYVETLTDSAEGRIVGTEALTNDDGNQIRRVTVVTDGGDLHQFRIDEIIEVRLMNEALEIGLSKSLEASLGEGDWKPVEINVHLSGDAPHEVFISYVVAMPTWKPTYRILVEDDDLFLQGWAVVDNVSGEDWGEVDLSLMAGTPISFRYDLHSPHFVSRPDMTSRGFVDMVAMAPTVEAGVLMPQSSSAPGYGDATGSRSNRSRRDRAEEAERSLGIVAEQQDEGGFDLESQMIVNSTAGSAQAEQLGSLFRYDVALPVTVPDRGSALVTILNEQVNGEDVLYFDPQSQSRNAPYRAVRMTNTTSYTVERGPLSIYKDATFVGQAITPRISEGQMIFLPYSVDGRFRLDIRESTSEEGLRLVRIINSVIFSEVQSVRRRTYQITNNSGESARMYIRVPKRTNWNLRTPDPATSGVIDQGGVWYVPVDLDTSVSREFTIEEVTNVSREVNIWSDLAVSTIGLYISNPDAEPAIREQLETVLGQIARVAEIDRETSSINQRQADLSRRQREIRQNIDVLGDTRESRALQQDLETRLGELVEESADLAVQQVTLQLEAQDLRDLIRTELMDLSLVPEPETPDEPVDE